MADKFWCLSCGAHVDGVKEVREFPAGDKVMVLTTISCVECGIGLVRSSTMRDKTLPLMGEVKRA